MTVFNWSCELFGPLVFWFWAAVFGVFLSLVIR